MLFVLVVAAVTFEGVSFGVALSGSVLAAVCLIRLREAVRRFESSISDLESRLPPSPPDGH